MKDIWKKYNIIILIIVFIAIFGSVIYFLVVPFMEKIKVISNNIQAQLIDRELEYSRISQLPQMEEDWRMIEEKQEDLNVMLNPENEVRFIENVESIASRTGNVLDLKIGENVNAKDVSKIKKTEDKSKDAKKGILDELTYLNFLPVQISLRGDYDGLVNFIHMLENSKFYINIISIKSEKQIDENSEQGGDVFNTSPGEVVEENNKKEIIISEINAIVYTKK